MRSFKYITLSLVFSFLIINIKSNAKTLITKNDFIKVSNSTKGKLICIRSKIKLGKIKRGKLVKQNFEFVNNSKNSVLILSVDPSCNCTKVSNDKKIDPNEKGKVSFLINTKDKQAGKNTVTAVVKTNGEIAFFYLVLEFELI